MKTQTTTRLVITGAPGSGKTAFLERLRGEAFARDLLFFEELARLILTEQPAMRGDWGAFHREIYRRQTLRESEAGPRSFVTDRGTVDAFAFHPETIADVGSSIVREYDRYSAVIQLGSAAALGFAYYEVDEVRNESMKEALAIEEKLKSAWQGHPKYHFIAADADIENKYDRFTALVRAIMAGEDLTNPTQQRL